MLIGAGPGLAWWLLDMCILNAFKLWAIGKQGARQLEFRIQLMHALVKLLEADQQALQTSRGVNASIALAKDHHPQNTGEDKRCVACAAQGRAPRRSVYICKACKVHLCVEPCFGLYHQ
jgi:hypothetical protein